MHVPKPALIDHSDQQTLPGESREPAVDDPAFEEQMRIAREIMRVQVAVLRELAKHD